jgi:hypothetical protein
VEQLIVGVLLFTPLLGLFPTTTTWYLSLCCCQGVLLGLRQLLAVAGRLLQMKCLLLLVSRWLFPSGYPCQVMVQPLCTAAADDRPADSGSLQGAAWRRWSAPKQQTSDSEGAASDRFPGVVKRQPQEPQHDQGVKDGKGQSRTVKVVLYQVSHEPCSYVEVLRHGTVVPLAGGAAGAAWASVQQLVRAVIWGEVWGLNMQLGQ